MNTSQVDHPRVDIDAVLYHGIFVEKMFNIIHNSNLQEAMELKEKRYIPIIILDNEIIKNTHSYIFEVIIGIKHKKQK